jgi:hypothetical protein
MNGKIVIVTPPDDIQIDGIRILAFDLTPDQSQLLSDVLKDTDDISTVVYLYNGNNNSEWVLDKKHKCSIIYFNADSEDQTMVGYLAAQKNSYYFGTLRSVGFANTNQIDSKETIKKLMEGETLKYARL